jgi:ketosteroid isomerase-like protein
MSPTATSDITRSDTTPVDTVRRIQESIGHGDMLSLMAHMAKDVRWAISCEDRSAAPFLAEYSGRQGVHAFFEAMHVVDVTAFDVKEIVGDGDTVWALLHIAWTAPTGRKVDMNEAQVWKFRGDKVVSVDIFPDTMAIATAFA